MDVNMERTNKMLALIHPIIYKMNGELGDFIERYVCFKHLSSELPNDSKHTALSGLVDITCTVP